MLAEQAVSSLPFQLFSSNSVTKVDAIYKIERV